MNLHWIPAAIAGLEGAASPGSLRSVLRGRSAGWQRVVWCRSRPLLGKIKDHPARCTQLSCALLPPQLMLPPAPPAWPWFSKPVWDSHQQSGAPRYPAPEPQRPIRATRRFHRKSPPALFHGDDAQRPRVPWALTVQDPHSNGLIWGQFQSPPPKGSGKWAHTPSSSLFAEDTVCPYLPRANAGKMKMSVKWLVWQPALLLAATFSVL